MSSNLSPHQCAPSDPARDAARSALRGRALEDVLQCAASLCSQFGVELPRAVTAEGIAGRLRDEQWRRPNPRRCHGPRAEAQGRDRPCLPRAKRPVALSPGSAVSSSVVLFCPWTCGNNCTVHGGSITYRRVRP
jgi:hypothetical protein